MPTTTPTAQYLARLRARLAALRQEQHTLQRGSGPHQPASERARLRDVQTLVLILARQVRELTGT
jgi:ribosome-interacting GTPase 1